MPITLEELLRRATAGRELNSVEPFRPSWFYNLLEDPFWIWCHYHAPAAEKLDETTLFDRYRMAQGVVWEEKYVAARFPGAFRIDASWGVEPLRDTLAAMLRGERVIHGGALWRLGDEICGKPDLLIRSDDGPSDLGAFHYFVQEVKNSAIVKPCHQLQATAYSWMLGALQGRLPATAEVVLREGAGSVTTLTADFLGELQRQLALWRDIRDGANRPEPLVYSSTTSPWRQYANRCVVARGDLSLLPGVKEATACQWRERGLLSLVELVRLGQAACNAELGGDHLYYHALAYQRQCPVFRYGDRAQISRRPRLVYFDVEDLTFADPPLVTRPHTYMLGVATPDGDSRIWTARGQDDEARMWGEFLDWLGDPHDVALYCWTMYERRKMEQAAAAHPELTSRLQTAAAALVDLKEEIKHRPYFPVPSYSIKSVAPFCGFRWSQDDVDGQSAQLIYLEWLRSGDDALIERVRQYNREDVLAMAAVDRVVTAMSENGAD